MAKKVAFVAALEQALPTKADQPKADQPAAWFQRGGVTWGETMAEANVSLATVAAEFRAMLVATGWNGAALPGWKELEVVLETARVRTQDDTGRKAGMPHVPLREEIAIGVVRKYDALYAPTAVEGEGDARKTVVRCGTGPGAKAYYDALVAAGELNAERLYRMPLAAFKAAYAADPVRKEAMKEARNMASRKVSEAWGFIVAADMRAQVDASKPEPEPETRRGAQATGAQATGAKAADAKAADAKAADAKPESETSIADVHPKVLIDFARKRGIELPLELQAAVGAYLKAMDNFIAATSKA